jgi:hypothetical protein
MNARTKTIAMMRNTFTQRGIPVGLGPGPAPTWSPGCGYVGGSANWLSSLRPARSTSSY